jgi:Ulp1 family protease
LNFRADRPPTSTLHLDGAAAVGLQELSCVLDHHKNNEVTKLQQHRTNGFAEKKFSCPLLVMSKSTIERLESDMHLNDTLINFWMKWIWRNSDKSNIHCFSSHFYTILEKDGPEGVTRWTKQRGVNIFTKKFIFIPINKSSHWSLCVIVNPGAILPHYDMLKNDDKNIIDITVEDNASFPCLLFFDSLKFHEKDRVGEFVRRWLNSEWKGLYPEQTTDAPFTSTSMEVFDPEIPYQINKVDCGVYVCRYAYAMYRMRERPFTYADVKYFDNPNTKQPCFTELITNHKAFDFNAEDIVRIRSEFMQLLERLCKMYLKWKKMDDDQKRLEKRRAKKLKGNIGGQELKAVHIPASTSLAIVVGGGGGSNTTTMVTLSERRLYGRMPNDDIV